MSDRELNEATTSILKKGLNFAVAPKKVPIEDIICNVESAIGRLPPDTAEDIRQDVCQILKQAKPPKPNISPKELKALRELREDDSIIILPADKGNATVVMELEQYKTKMYDLLSDTAYKVIKNPSNRITRKINGLIKNSSIPPERHRFLTTSDPIPPKIYGLPKVHKEGTPLRPIVSAIGSPTHKVARYLANIIQPHIGLTETHVQDSRHFISLIKSLIVSTSDILVSFDVCSLFTKVPIGDTITLISNILPPDLTNLAAECLKSTYFYFDGKYYEQVEGAAMGSPLSPVVANLYMENFEQRALATAPLKPKVFLRYVDDTFVIWPHGKVALDDFLQHLNSIHPNIKFTMEIEKDNTLAFLDVLVRRNSNGTLRYGVYRKPTHTDRYLQAKSHHHPSQKSAVIHTLVSRAIAISDSNSYNSEKKHLTHVLLKNGYSLPTIQRAFTKHENKPQIKHSDDMEDNKPVSNAVLPYLKGTTDRIGKILIKHQIRTVFKPLKKVKQFLRPIKDNIKLQTPGVYHIPCSCGTCYVGESRRLISTRLKEHIRSTKNETIEVSAVAKHSYETKHLINFEDTTILASIQDNYKRKIREAIEIKKHPHNMNLDCGYVLNKNWLPIINKLPKCKENSRTFTNTIVEHSTDPPPLLTCIENNGEESTPAARILEAESSRMTSRLVYNLRPRHLYKREGQTGAPVI